MKLRQGFVSNSSTSSFICFGIPLDTAEKLEVFKKLIGYVNKGTIKKPNCKHEFTRDTFKFCPECGKEAWEVIDQDEDFVYNIDNLFECSKERKKLNKIGFEIISGWLDDMEEDVYFLGINLEDTTENGKKTLEKINKVNDKIMELFPEKIQDQNFYSGTKYE